MEPQQGGFMYDFARNPTQTSVVEIEVHLAEPRHSIPDLWERGSIVLTETLECFAESSLRSLRYRLQFLVLAGPQS